jgi:hypothetical protein
MRQAQKDRILPAPPPNTPISAKINARVVVFVFDSVRRERLRSHSIVGVLQQEGYEVSGLR